MPRIFVTGGAGYVGSHCCKAFAAAGWEVVTFDNLSRGWREFVQWGELIEGDIRDKDTLAAALTATKPDAVAHFAALAYVHESVEDPALYYNNNVRGTLNLLEAMTDIGCNKLLFSSSCAVYGIPHYSPLDEAHPKAPINPYGWTKLICEQMISDFETAHGLRAVALRYFNAGGADADGKIGERHEPEPHLIPLILRALSDANYAFTVHGADYETPDGTAIRDFVHVADLADAHLRAIDHLVSGGESLTLNLGTGTGVSVAEMIGAAEEITGRKLTARAGARRPGDPPRLMASPQLAAEVLDWTPMHSSVEEIIKSALAWHQTDQR